MTEGRDDRSLGELFAELAHETGTLVRQELQQAGTEIGQRARGAGKDLAVLVVGAVIAHAALLALIAAVIIGLADLGLDWWLSALLVAVVLVGVGYALIRRAQSALTQADLLPRHTMETIKEDQQWVKEQVS